MTTAMNGCRLTLNPFLAKSSASNYDSPAGQRSELSTWRDMTYLRVDEVDTKDVGQEEDGLVLGVVDGGRCDVGPNAVDEFYFSCDKTEVRSSTVDMRFL